MERFWTITSVALCPITSCFFVFLPWLSRARFSALASGLIVFLILWLYALPRDLALNTGPVAIESRFAVPLAAYAVGLAVAAILTSWAVRKPA